ncbi:urea ABC transporter permease subunit UrtC [Galbitalea soli]|uniref:Urea ABC transporter permease subunit UrtC n=1 Tax=Galbitalea soli TaxID=1268042 RepID=A0A7C9PL32_9MICO|nr:urea ABC transporter permease subunit UrtC [Galbitalea soli]NEM89950.1 urea ABC transporter permease subunit UrtC [Galbitalea soli]NYJ30656.1 urea transport system permease protein [Galbitalea soli]
MSTAERTAVTATRTRGLRRILRPRARLWLGTLAAALILFVVAPAALSGYQFGLLAQFLCYAMVAVGIGLAWGQGGMLTLGQGLFFGIGGYAMAMHLQLDDAGPGGVPAFMSLYGSGTVPAWWEPFRDPWITIGTIILLPAALAALLGYAIFARRVRGAYFAILSQALVAAFAILLIGQQASTGGSTGLSNFRGFFGYSLADPLNQRLLFFLAAGTLIGMVLLVRLLMRSRYGELLVATRDQEMRVRFLGYNPALVKTVAFVVSSVFAAVGGALFVPIAGIISPSDVAVVPSIMFVAGVAIGGRATLLGPVLGSLALSWVGAQLQDNYPSVWSYFQGALFVLVLGFLPQGFATLGGVLRRRKGDSR